MIRKIVSQYFLGYTGVNEAIHTKNNVKKFRSIGILVSVLYGLGMMLWAYVYQLQQMLGVLAGLGLEAELVTLGVVAALLFGLVGAWLKSANILFGSHDLPLWLSSPVSRFQLVLGKSLTAYMFELLPTLAFMMPPLFIVGNAIQADLTYYLLGMIGALLLPIPVFILGTGLGILTQVLFKGISSKKTMMQTISLFIFIIGIIVFSFTASSFDWEGMMEALTYYLSAPRGFQALTRLYVNLIFHSRILTVGLYFIFQLSAIGVFIGLISQYYDQILNLFKPSGQNGTVGKVVYKESAPFIALYKREFKRYFSSSVYVINTLMGSVLLVVFTIAIVVTKDSVLNIVELVGVELGLDLGEGSMAMIAILISALMVMSCTTASAISLEGKQFSVLKSFPVSVMTILGAKIGINLTICLGALIICLPVIFWILPFTLIEMGLTVWLTVGYSLFTALLGLVINLKFPIFDWQVEAVAVKQSVSVFISMVSGMIAIAGPIFVGITFFSVDLLLLLVGVALMVTIVNIGLFMFLKIIGTKWFLSQEIK